jgi:hypothetical protein
MRWLAHQLGTRPPKRVVHRADGSIEELLLEEEVDGARYTVLRTYRSRVAGWSP